MERIVADDAYRRLRRYGEAPPKTNATIAGADWYGRSIERENTLFVDLDMTETQTLGVAMPQRAIATLP